VSIIQTNSIVGLGTNGVRINCPVGVNQNYSSDGLVVSGSVVVENSGAEVVTVASENFGVKIKGLTGAPVIYRGQSIFNPFEASLFFSNNFSGGQTSGRRADITSTIRKDIRFNTSYTDSTKGFTGPVFTNASAATGGLYITETLSTYSAPATFQDTVDFGILGSPFNSQSTFNAAYMPKCSGVAEEDDDIINNALLKSVLLSTSTVKFWSVFGTLDNGGVSFGTGRSGNFFRRLFGRAKTTCCCSCSNTPGAQNQGAYTETLQGTWTCIGFSFGRRSCSCYDNEQFHFPIDYSKVWSITNDSVKNTIPANLSGTYNLFGFLIKQPY
jgi:hypothetical protein